MLDNRVINAKGTEMQRYILFAGAAFAANNVTDSKYLVGKIKLFHLFDFVGGPKGYNDIKRHSRLKPLLQNKLRSMCLCGLCV